MRGPMVRSGAERGWLRRSNGASVSTMAASSGSTRGRGRSPAQAARAWPRDVRRPETGGARQGLTPASGSRSCALGCPAGRGPDGPGRIRCPARCRFGQVAASADPTPIPDGVGKAGRRQAKRRNALARDPMDGCRRRRCWAHAVDVRTSVVGGRTTPALPQSPLRGSRLKAWRGGDRAVVAGGPTGGGEEDAGGCRGGGLGGAQRGNSRSWRPVS